MTGEWNGRRNYSENMGVDVKVRSFCCALHTFAKVAFILLAAAHATAAATACAWLSMAGYNDRGAAAAAILLITVGTTGSVACLLALWSLRKGARTLLIPWLVLHMLVIIGK